MLIAQKLRQKNIVGYVLYMFQLEDTVRAYHADIDALSREYLPKLGLDDEQYPLVRDWYEGLCRMMREEGCMDNGHIQVVRNTIILLNDRHQELLRDTKQPFYSATYYKALPYIVELRAHGASREQTEIENCLTAMYGAALLGMQHRELTPQTKAALQPISRLLEMLSEKYKDIPEQ